MINTGITIEIVGEMIIRVNIVTIIDIMVVVVVAIKNPDQGHQMKEKVADTTRISIVEDLRVLQGLRPRNINIDKKVQQTTYY